MICLVAKFNVLRMYSEIYFKKLYESWGMKMVFKSG